MSFAQVIERVDREARALKFQRSVLAVVTAVLFALGWLVGIVFRGIWLVFAWAWAAAVVGFRTARGGPG